MSFIKMLSRLANLKYFPLVLSLILLIPFTPLEIPTIYGADYINRISIPYRKGGVKTLSFLTGFTLLPITSSSHFPIISDAQAATYYLDATNGNDLNSGTSELTPWKTIAKVNSSNFNPGSEILFKGGRFVEGNLSFLLQDKKPNRLSVSLIHLSRPDTLSIKGHFPTLLRTDLNDQTQNTNVGPAAFVKNKRAVAQIILARVLSLTYKYDKDNK